MGRWLGRPLALSFVASAAMAAPSAAPPLPVPASASPPAAAPSAANVLTATGPPPVAPKPIGACDAAQRDKGVVRIGLAHFNDLQARYSDRISGRSRYAYIAGYLKQLKATQPTLVLDAGDDYEKGALAELRSFGETTRQMVQALPIDVRSIGNHDFAYGEAAVLRDVRLSAHPVLAANIRYTGLATSKQPFRSFVRVDVGCLKVGVIGLVTQSYGADDQPTSLPFDSVFVQDDHYQAILEREAKAHRGEVDVLIALTHLGYADDIALAHKGGKLVDVIVGGHTEDLVSEPTVVPHSDSTKTWVLQAGHFGETLGQGEIVVNLTKKKVALDRYKIVDVDDSLPHADDVADLAKRLEDAVVPDAHNPIGKVGTTIKQAKMPDLLFKAVASTWNADALVVGRDLFWSGLGKGDVTLQRLYNAVLVQRQPPGTSGFSSIWMCELTGVEMAQVAKGFKQGASTDWYGMDEKFDPQKNYRLAIDKRAATYPKALFGSDAKLLKPTFRGEMIDALEAYARARTAKGQTID